MKYFMINMIKMILGGPLTSHCHEINIINFSLQALLKLNLKYSTIGELLRHDSNCFFFAEIDSKCSITIIIYVMNSLKV